MKTYNERSDETGQISKLETLSFFIGLSPSGYHRNPTTDDMVYGNDAELQYYKSWNWIMPVWRKFRDLDFDDAPGADDEHREWINSLQWYLFSSDEPGRFADRLYYAIKWYNGITEACIPKVKEQPRPPEQ